MLRTLTGKTIFANGLVLLACFVALLFVTDGLVSRTIEDKNARNAQVFTGLLANQIATGTRLKRGAMVAPQIDTAMATKGLNLAAIRVTHVEGIEVLATLAENFGEEVLTAADAPSFEETITHREDGNILYTRSPILLGQGSDQVLVGELLVVWDLVPLRQRVFEMSRTMSLLFLGTLLVVGFATFMALRSFMGQPLRAAVRSLAQVIEDPQAEYVTPRRPAREISAIYSGISAFQASQTERLALEEAERKSREDAERVQAQKLEADRAAETRARQEAEAQQRAAEEQAKKAAQLLEDLADVLEHARKGDFGARMDESGHIPEQKAVRRMVNGLLSAVDDGLGETLRVVAALSKKNLNVRMSGDFEGAFAQLMHDVNQTAELLASAISEIASRANGVLNDAGEISAAADDLSRRTDKNAASLAETAKSLDEIDASIKSASKGADQVRGVIETARTEAARSESIVQSAVEAMHEIEKNASEIAETINLINGIAFQTNLLALNAGVEAARAGESGRGFTVVASEVRALAQRASEAAAEIEALISKSVAQVQTGVDHVDEAGKAIAVLGEAVGEIYVHTSKIADSISEQADSVSTINGSVRQIDGATQQNAAMFEETTAATHSLRSSADAMSELVNTFEFNDMKKATLNSSAA